MSQVATLYIVRKSDLTSDDFNKTAIEKIEYNWSGFAFIILSVFSNEMKSFDWDKLELTDIANKLSEKSNTGIMIFSAKDKETALSQLNPGDFSVDDLDVFAFEFSEEEGWGVTLMEAIKTLQIALNKIDNDSVVVLEIC